MKKIINKYKEIILYIIFGILTTIINLSVYYLLTYTILNPKKTISLILAIFFAWIACVGFAYLTNKKYVFNSKNKITLKEALLFYKYRIYTLILETIFMFILIKKFNLNDKIIKPIIQIIIIVLNYIFSKIFVFKKRN